MRVYRYASRIVNISYERIMRFVHLRALGESWRRSSAHEYFRRRNDRKIYTYIYMYGTYDVRSRDLNDRKSHDMFFYRAAPLIYTIVLFLLKCPRKKKNTD